MPQDLAARNVSMGDIVTPSPNRPHGLFQEITGILQTEYGFATFGTPLMFEATVASDQSLSILVTKMAMPTNEYGDQMDPGAYLQNLMGGFTPQMNQFAHNQDSMGHIQPNGMPPPPPPGPGQPGHRHGRHGRKQKKPPESGYILYSFEDIDVLAFAASRIGGDYTGKNHVYKMEGKYHLLMQSNAQHSTKKLEGLLSDFGKKETTSPLSYNQMIERGEPVIAEDAINKLKAYH